MAAKKKTAKKASATVESNVAPEAPEAAQVPEGDSTQLTIADLQTLAQAIDIASRRGAYGASEMGDVGAVYTKLTGFLQVIAEQQQAAQGGE